MEDWVSKIWEWDLKEKAAGAAMAGEVSGSREDGKEGCSQPPLPQALVPWFLRLPPASCVNWWKNHWLSVPLVQDEAFKLPFRPVLFVCSVGQMWQRVALAQAESVSCCMQVHSSQHHKLPLGPRAVAGELIQRKICTPALNAACAHGGPLLFHLQVFESKG